MNMKRVCLTACGVAVFLMPSVLAGQVDPSGNTGANPYPQSPQGMNQSAPGQTGSNPAATGAQANQPTSMRDSLGAPGETGQQMLDQRFVRSATQIGIGDVQLGTLATQKGGSDVKELAQKLVDDHNAMNKELGSVADAMGVMLPKKMTKDDQAEYEKLNGLSGKDFDTEYLTYIDKAHWQSLHMFYTEASASANTDLQTDVVKDMGTMHQHLGMIAKTAKQDGITLPPRPPRPPRPGDSTASK
jgi:putative membrane protein